MLWITTMLLVLQKLSRPSRGAVAVDASRLSATRSVLRKLFFVTSISVSAGVFQFSIVAGTSASTALKNALFRIVTRLPALKPTEKPWLGRNTFFSIRQSATGYQR